MLLATAEPRLRMENGNFSLLASPRLIVSALDFSFSSRTHFSSCCCFFCVSEQKSFRVWVCDKKASCEQRTVQRSRIESIALCLPAFVCRKNKNQLGRHVACFYRPTTSWTLNLWRTKLMHLQNSKIRKSCGSRRNSWFSLSAVDTHSLIRKAGLRPTNWTEHKTKRHANF